MRNLLPLLLLAALITPFASAHGAPNPIEAEDLILDDEATDLTAGWDGWDIMSVHIREAYLTGEHGIVVRWTLWGGDTIGVNTDHQVDLSFTSPDTTLTWTSSDNGQSWDGTGTVLEVEWEQDVLEADQTIPTWNVQFQAFVPHRILGSEVGGSLDGATAAAYASDTIVDVAPGGFYNGAAPVELTDPMDPDSTRLIDSLLLDGPDRYTESTITVTDGVLHVQVANLINVSGQHIFAKTSLQPVGLADEHDEAGNHVAGGKEADPGQAVDFTIPVGDFDVLQVFIETDLGGQEVFWVRSDGKVSTNELDATLEDPVEAPAVPVLFVAIAALALAALRRR